MTPAEAVAVCLDACNKSHYEVERSRLRIANILAEMRSAFADIDIAMRLEADARSNLREAEKALRLVGEELDK